MDEITEYYNDHEWLQADLMEAKGQLELYELKLFEMAEAIRIQKLHIALVEKRLKELE